MKCNLPAISRICFDSSSYKEGLPLKKEGGFIVASKGEIYLISSLFIKKYIDWRLTQEGQEVPNYACPSKYRASSLLLPGKKLLLGLSFLLSILYMLAFIVVAIMLYVFASSITVYIGAGSAFLFSCIIILLDYLFCQHYYNRFLDNLDTFFSSELSHLIQDHLSLDQEKDSPYFRFLAYSRSLKKIEMPFMIASLDSQSSESQRQVLYFSTKQKGRGLANSNNNSTIDLNSKNPILFCKLTSGLLESIELKLYPNCVLSYSNNLAVSLESREKNESVFN